jgi:hypothetical protein
VVLLLVFELRPALQGQVECLLGFCEFLQYRRGRFVIL